MNTANTIHPLYGISVRFVSFSVSISCSTTTSSIMSALTLSDATMSVPALVSVVTLPLAFTLSRSVSYISNSMVCICIVLSWRVVCNARSKSTPVVIFACVALSKSHCVVVRLVEHDATHAKKTAKNNHFMTLPIPPRP